MKNLCLCYSKNSEGVKAFIALRLSKIEVSMKRDIPKFKVSYCKSPMPETLKAEKYIKFLKHLARIVKEQEALANKRKHQ